MKLAIDSCKLTTQISYCAWLEIVAAQHWSFHRILSYINPYQALSTPINDDHPPKTAPH